MILQNNKQKMSSFDWLIHYQKFPNGSFIIVRYFYPNYERQGYYLACGFFFQLEKTRLLFRRLKSKQEHKEMNSLRWHTCIIARADKKKRKWAIITWIKRRNFPFHTTQKATQLTAPQLTYGMRSANEVVTR